SSRQTHALHDDGKRRCAAFRIEGRNNPREIWQTEHPCEVESHGRSDEHDRAAIHNEKQQAARREGESQCIGQHTPAARPEEGHENSTQKTRESRRAQSPSYEPWASAGGASESLHICPCSSMAEMTRQ